MNTKEEKMVQNQPPEGSATIAALINDLGNKDGIVRQKARNALVQIGLPEMGSLTVAFEKNLINKKLGVIYVT